MPCLLGTGVAMPLRLPPTCVCGTLLCVQAGGRFVAVRCMLRVLQAEHGEVHRSTSPCSAILHVACRALHVVRHSGQWLFALGDTQILMNVLVYRLGPSDRIRVYEGKSEPSPVSELT